MPPTEIRFLIDIMLNYKLPGPVKEKFLARIGEVEARLSQKPVLTTSNDSAFTSGCVSAVQAAQAAQVPSTQKILSEMAAAQPPPPTINRTIVPQEVTTFKGNGTSTRGPRKF